MLDQIAAYLAYLSGFFAPKTSFKISVDIGSVNYEDGHTTSPTVFVCEYERVDRNVGSLRFSSENHAAIDRLTERLASMAEFVSVGVTSSPGRTVVTFGLPLTVAIPREAQQMITRRIAKGN